MPFQLDTGFYGSVGAQPRQQQSPFGMLGELMDWQARQENLRGMQEQRDYINEQRQLAIAKAQRDAAKEQALRELPPDATREQLVRIVGPEDADKIIDQRIKAHTAKVGTLASVLGAIKTQPPDKQQQAFYDAQDDLVNQGILTQDDMREYSPEYVDQAQRSALSALQQLQEATSAKNAETAASAERRLREKQDAEMPGLKAKAQQDVRVEAVPRLMNVKKGDWEAYVANYNAIPKDQRSGIPTPQDWTRNFGAAQKKLATLGLTPAEMEANADRDAARAQAERHFNITEARLGAQGGVTKAMRQAALVRKANDMQSLAQEKSRRANEGLPMSPLEELQRTAQIDQNYRAETGEPPSRDLAEKLKQASLDDLEGRIKKRQQSPGKDAQGNALPARPMTKEAIDAEKLAIQNRYRADLGMESVTQLPPEWGGAAPTDNTLGALTNTTPPTVAAPPRPAPPAPPPTRGGTPPLPNSPAALSPQSATEAADVLRQINQLRPRAGTPSVDQQLLNLRDRYRVLTGR